MKPGLRLSSSLSLGPGALFASFCPYVKINPVMHIVYGSHEAMHNLAHFSTDRAQ